MATVASHASEEGNLDVHDDGTELWLLWRPTGDSAAHEMARYSYSEQVLRIFPKMRFDNSLQSQFSQIEELQFEQACIDWDPADPADLNATGQVTLPGMPPGIGHLVAYGLGFPRKYRGFAQAVEDISGTRIIRVTAGDEEFIEGNICQVTLDRFNDYRTAVDRNRNRGSAVVGRLNSTEARNAVADLAGVDRSTSTVGRHPVVRAITRELTGGQVLDAEERTLLLEQASVQARSAAEETPVEFGRLRREFELVSFDVLIEQFTNGMTGSHAKKEPYWQDFFEANSFALQQLFAAPIAIYGPQLTVKSANAFGQGARIADFVLANTATRSAFVVEIKTPATPLLGPAYRGKGGSEVFPPNRELAGAVVQVQAQLESVRSNLDQLLHATPGAEPLETCVVRGAVIVGSVATLSTEEKASFMRYREGLAGVEVIAFDEVRDRLKTLCAFLSQDDG